jgi:trk system potassium uptake protein TrkH
VVLLLTALLIIIGFLGVFGVENNHVLKYENPITQLLSSVFQSVTARTAGFNTIPIYSLTNATLIILMFLMYFGAAPGSCGGGVKVTTLGVLIAYFYSRVKRYDEPTFLKRTFPRETVEKVIAIVLSSIALIGLIFFLLLITEGENHSIIESRGHFIKLLFETMSAFGTVGLSMGVTSQLSTMGRLLITLLMLVGRIGPLTLAVAFSIRERSLGYRYAKGEIMVG